MSILLLAWVFLASFATTLLVAGAGSQLATRGLASFRRRHGAGEPAGAGGLAAAPGAIHLLPAGGEPWKRSRAAGRLVRGFAREGFRSAGVFAIPEIPGTRVELFAHPGQRLIGAVHEDRSGRHWTDVSERRSDGSTVTWSSARPTGVDPRPGHPRFHVPGASPAALVARALRERAPAPAEEVHPAELEALFERAYAEEAEWRHRQDGAA